MVTGRPELHFFHLFCQYFQCIAQTEFAPRISGKSWIDKVKQIRGELAKKNAFAVVVAALDEVACELLTSSVHFLCNIL